MGRLSVGERLASLAAAVEAAAGAAGAVDAVDAVDTATLDEARRVLNRAGERMRLAPERTVVAVAGSTGSGKSSVVNALAGEAVAAVDVLRPTTSEALAVLTRTADPGPGGTGDALLDWLGVRRRHTLTPTDPTAAVLPADLVLLDLPDHDSVEVDHRWEAERLVALVDLMVWVVDPQKYADAALHERYLRRLGEHRAVLLVVLNQVDRLDPDERAACAQDLRRLLTEDGLGPVPLLPLSARTGEGVEALRSALADAARRREAATARVLADVVQAAGGVREACGDAVGEVGPQRRAELVRALGRAAGVPTVVDAVRAGVVHRGRRATGWPVTRWVVRLRPDPLRRLHLGSARSGADEDREVATTSLPRAGAVEQARARQAVRGYVDAATEGLPTSWRVLAAQAAQAPDLADRLDHAVAAPPDGRAVPDRRPAWWGVVGAVQWLWFALAAAGALWLTALAVLAWLQVPAPPTPVWGEVPYPTVGLVGGVVLGVATALLARAGVHGGARRAARRADVVLGRAVADVADAEVVRPVTEVLRRAATCRDEATAAADGRRPPGRHRRGGGAS